MIRLPSFAITALKRHAEREAQERAFAGEQWKDHGLGLYDDRRNANPAEQSTATFHALLDALKIERHAYTSVRSTVDRVGSFWPHKVRWLSKWSPGYTS